MFKVGDKVKFLEGLASNYGIYGETDEIFTIEEINKWNVTLSNGYGDLEDVHHSDIELSLDRISINDELKVMRENIDKLTKEVNYLKRRLGNI